MLLPVGQAARADVVLVAGRASNRGRVRRVVSVLAMTAGAPVGGLLPRHADEAARSGSVAGLPGGCSPAAERKSRRTPPGPGAEAKRASIASWSPVGVVGRGEVP
jgi:hypothetical protein